MSESETRTAAKILLVEDSAADIELTRQGLLDAKLANELLVVRDGREALDFLRRRGAYADAPRPDLILLDLNLPHVPGIEVLREVKSDDDLRDIPIVLLTTSSNMDDIKEAYNLRANCYITKPVRFVEFLDVVKQISGFWFQLVRLPAAR